MVNRQTDRGRRATFLARMSMETIVVVFVVFATVAILTLKVMAAHWDDSDSSAPARVAGLRHDAMSETPVGQTSSQSARPLGAEPAEDGTALYSSPTKNEAAIVAADQTEDHSSDTMVRNGVTVVSPPLLIPVISADALQGANGADAISSAHKAPSARKRFHYAGRAHARNQRRVLRSDPFWRLVAR